MVTLRLGSSTFPNVVVLTESHEWKISDHKTLFYVQNHYKYYVKVPFGYVNKVHRKQLILTNLGFI